MPELPEVEVVRLGLEPAFVGSHIESVRVFDARSLKRHDSRRGDFVGLLTGRTVLSTNRRGKFMWFPLSDSTDALVVHLGMSGQVLLRDGTATAGDKHLRIQLAITQPAREKAAKNSQHEYLVNFVDQRIFGSMAVDQLVDDGLGGLIPGQAAHIARDPLDPLFDDDLFVARTLRKQTGIKRALLDQQLISGVGNIYADEALWAAQIHGERSSDSLSEQQIRDLLEQVRQVFAKALNEGGTSFDSVYVNVNGQSGYFSHSLNAYGQQGKPCTRCGVPIVRTTFMNRGSHYCPNCQRS